MFQDQLKYVLELPNTDLQAVGSNFNENARTVRTAVTLCDY